MSGWVLVLALAMFTFAGSGWAQVTTAKFYGIVADPTGALIPTATITLTEERTGVSRTATADASGEFVFDFLRVGVYTLRIEAQGFKRYQGRGMEFAAAQNVRQTFVLDLGTVTETVEVAGVTTAVNTVSTEQREGVSAMQVSELPLSRRNYTGLLTMATGVTIDLGTQPGHGDRDGGLRLNGLGRSGATFTVDGTDANANNEGRSGNMFTNLNYIDIISIEAIQEVQTVKGVIAAEYGQALSGNVNIITKSGTNEYHASAFENFQSQRLNARNQFLTNKPPLTFNPNCPIIQTVANPGQTGHPWGSEFFSKQRIVAEIDYHRVKAPLEPAIEGVQVPPARPRRGHTVPAVQLLLKNLAAHLFQTLADLFLILGFRKQVDRRFSPEIFQAQSATRGIRPMQPIQKWLARHHHDRCSVESGHAVSA